MKLIAAVFLGLVFPASATAALEVKLSVVPGSPKMGASTVVQLRPYWTYNRPDGSCCVLKQAAVTYPFKLQAVSPSGRVTRIVVRRTRNRYVWAGRIMFRTRGTWTLRAPQWGPRYSRNFGARPRIQVRVT
jgi:hypothetical protein